MKAIGLVLLVVASPVFAGQWIHIEPTSSGNPCAARLSSSEVDTTLTLNQSGDLVLIAGRADWRASGPETVSLQIDNFKVNNLQASAFNNLILLLIKDESIVNRLKVAKSLDWYLPSGTYHAAVTGLGDALNWLRTCEEAKRVGLDSR